MSACGVTDVGRTREHNEDAFLIGNVGSGERLPEDGVTDYPVDDHALLLIVADGMGGAAAGEVASAMAVETVFEVVSTSWRDSETRDAADFVRGLRAAAVEANSRIHARAVERPEYRGMGTTATAAGLLGDTLYVAQVGDSRAYLVRGGEALQITKDQSLLQRLVDAGELTEEEAERSARRNIILQALGPEANILIDLTHQQIRRGDTLILCSDGLTGSVRGEEIAYVVRDSVDVREICERLVAAANENGGPDNITVVAARFEGEGLLEAQTGDQIGHTRFEDDGTPFGADDWIDADPGRVRAQPRRAPAVQEPASDATPAEPVPKPLDDAERQRRAARWMRTLGVVGAIVVLLALWQLVGTRLFTP